MWDCNGLESLFNVDTAKSEIAAWEKEKIFATLREENIRPRPNPIPLNMMILRARVNSQRKYEIYEFNSTIGELELREQFLTDPQPLVDWIRQNGHKIYSDHSTQRNFIT